VQLKNFPGSGAFAALALSCALGFGSDGCQALALGEYQAKPGDTLDLYVAGSWAQDNTLQQLLQLICETDSLDVYRAPGRYVRLFFCRMKSSQASLAGLPPGQKIAFHKSSIAGGGSGVGPLIQRTPVEFLNVEDLRDHLDDRCPAASRMKHAGQGDLSGFTEYECLNPTPRFEVPDVGMSDVEPKFFLNPFGLGPSALEALSVHHPSALIYGVPVSLGLRNALQSARFAKSQPCNPANPHYAERVAAGHGSHVARGETEECMPGLSRVQLAGVFSGALTDWGQIINPEGYPLAAEHGGQSGGIRDVFPQSAVRFRRQPVRPVRRQCFPGRRYRRRSILPGAIGSKERLGSRDTDHRKCRVGAGRSLAIHQDGWSRTDTAQHLQRALAILRRAELPVAK
jgi:hypothetical protein